MSAIEVLGDGIFPVFAAAFILALVWRALE